MLKLQFRPTREKHTDSYGPGTLWSDLVLMHSHDGGFDQAASSKHRASLMEWQHRTLEKTNSLSWLLHWCNNTFDQGLFFLWVWEWQTEPTLLPPFMTNRLRTEVKLANIFANSFFSRAKYKSDASVQAARAGCWFVTSPAHPNLISLRPVCFSSHAKPHSQVFFQAWGDRHCTSSR